MGEQRAEPSSHYNGRGCSVCGKIERASNSAMGRAEFEKRGREKFGMKSDYSNVEYKNNRTPVEISCEIHGPFTQTP